MLASEEVAYMRAAYFQATNSPDVSTQNGAVLVAWDGSLVFGYNSPPLGIDHTAERLTGDDKYDWIVHAEHSVILHAASQGVSTFGATLYTPWFSCIRCAVSMVQAGVSRVVGHALYHEFASHINPKWNKSIEDGWTALQEAGVVMEWITSPVACASGVLVGGSLFDPSL